jgi:very-short-patch-repair endonuclease
MQRLFRGCRLPIPSAEHEQGPDGEYRLDFAYADRKLAIEVDGYVWHFSPDHLKRDHSRRNRLQAAGWRVLVYTWRDVTQDPGRVASEIAAAYGAAA